MKHMPMKGKKESAVSGSVTKTNICKVRKENTAL
jgi:hypothetical protein